MVSLTKRCGRCKHPMPTEMFHRRERSPDGLASYCKPCAAEYRNAWRAANIEKAREIDRRSYARNNEVRRRAKRKYLYGLTPEGFEALVVAQGDACAVCGTPGMRESGQVDHDHATGEVRGLLCFGCNRGLGSFRDNPAALRAAADYLESHS